MAVCICVNFHFFDIALQFLSILIFRSVFSTGDILSKQTYMMVIQSFKEQCLADYIISLFHMRAYEAVFFVSDSGLG